MEERRRAGFENIPFSDASHGVEAAGFQSHGGGAVEHWTSFGSEVAKQRVSSTGNSWCVR
jgi:hypothetical protein